MEMYKAKLRSQMFLIFGLVILLFSIVISLDAVFEINTAFLDKKNSVEAQDAYDNLKIQLKDWALDKNTNKAVDDSTEAIYTLNTNVISALDQALDLASRSGDQQELLKQLRNQFIQLNSNQKIMGLHPLKQIDSIIDSMSKNEKSRFDYHSETIASFVNRLIYWSITSVIIAIILIGLAIYSKRDEDRIKILTIQNLQKMKDAADSASVLKSKFLSTVSHELRTPLNGIIGLSDILVSSQLNAAEQKLAKTIQQSGKTLLRIINDILDFSKIESGKLELVNSSFSIVDVFNQVLLTLSPQAAKKSIHINYEIDPAVPSEITADSERLSQVLFNLVGNSIKFTQIGSIVLRAKVNQKTEANCSIMFSVQDTGIGLSDEQKKDLFKPFTQLKKTGTTGEPGTGLGLSISQSIVEAMNGKIEVSSQLGQGSQFSFELKFNEFSKQPLNHTPTFRASGIENESLTILPIDASHRLVALVAEDNPTNQIVAQSLLERLGIESVVVSNGEEVITALTENHRFDFILMDCQMPLLDGFETTRILRRKGNMIPIIALTANAFEDDEKRCLNAGMDGFVSKPVDFFVLREVIAKALLADSKPLFIDKKTLEKLRQAIGIDNQKKVVHSFLNSMDSFESEIREASESKDILKLNRLGHKLKGSSKTVGATCLSETSESLENSTDVKIAISICDLIIKNIKETSHELKSYS